MSILSLVLRSRYFSTCNKVHPTTGAPKLINSNLFLEKRATGTVARFSRNKSLLIGFGAPVILQTKYVLQSAVVHDLFKRNENLRGYELAWVPVGRAVS